MKIPECIEKAIEKAGKCTKENRDNSEIVREWLINKGLIDEDSNNITNESVVDYVIDCIESGVDGSAALIVFLKAI